MPDRPTADQLAEKVKRGKAYGSEWSIDHEALADLLALAKRTEQAEKERDEAKKLVTAAYDQWGDVGHPTNGWRRRAEKIGCWPPRTNG